MRTVEEQLQLTLGPLAPLPPLEVSLAEVRGCVLAEDITARHPIPSFDTVATSGYAVASVDLRQAEPNAPVELNVIDSVPAGFRSSAEIASGTAIRVQSGAMVPAGADAVVAIDSTDGGSTSVLTYQPVSVGQSIRTRGTDAQVESVILPAGAVLTERAVGIAVTAGRATVLVHPKPRVVVITTGSELVEPGAPLEPGLVHDVNSVSLMSAIAGAGGQPYRGGPVADDAQALSSMIADQLVRADVIVVTGGLAPGGPTDQVLNASGTFDFSRTAVEPGRMVGAGVLGADRVPVFALPGDPAAALVEFEVFVRPVIRRLLGYSELFRPVVRATLTGDLSTTSGVRTFVAAQLAKTDSGFSVSPLPAGPSTSTIEIAQANALIIVTEDVTQQATGDLVSVIRLDRE